MNKFLTPRILLILVVVLAGTSIYFYRQFSVIKQDPNAISKAEVRTLTEKVGRLIVLPQDEDPTVATVSDPEALKDQTFFADAKKGDKVLIYTNAKKAILYDPTLNKIITVAPLTIGDSPSGSVTQEELSGSDGTE
jgi:hypothetical protein